MIFEKMQNAKRKRNFFFRFERNETQLPEINGNNGKRKFLKRQKSIFLANKLVKSTKLINIFSLIFLTIMERILKTTLFGGADRRRRRKFDFLSSISEEIFTFSGKIFSSSNFYWVMNLR